jgi:uncharacterized protein YfaS (alpha-2-macroglobulin family)
MMRTAKPRRRALIATLGLGLAAAIGGLAASSTPTTAGNKPPAKAGVQGLASPAAGWKEVDRLVGEEKLQAALDLATKIREAAQAKGDASQWARGLIRETQLRMGLHGYETAVRFLREQKWPDEPLAHALLDLFYAQSLTVYQGAYGYEIGQREEVVSTAVPDLKQWTRAQIYLEAQKAFLSAWKHRAEWGDTPATVVEEFVSPGDFPPEIRGTLRDAVSYLYAALLAEESVWEPAQDNELYRLPLETMIEGAPGAAGADALAADEGAHPLLKMAAVLGDLEAWHRDRARPEAAFEARRQRLEHLHASLTTDDDQTRLRKALADALARLGDSYPWWSRGQATLAEWTRGLDEPDAIVHARAIALAGAKKHPDSVGGALCKRIVAEIEAPQYTLAAMASDGPGKRSIQVTHRSLPRLWLRAYALDLDARLRTARDYNLLPAWQEVQDLVTKAKPAASWSIDLPPTPDYRDHRTFVTPPLQRPGLYVVVASARQDFAGPRNRRAGVNLVVGDLVLLSEYQRDGSLLVRVVSGSTGRPVPGADVELWRFDWGSGHSREQKVATDEAGEARLKWSNNGNARFLVARHEGDTAVSPDYLYSVQAASDDTRQDTLLYTDRSIYRPGQQLHWKAVAYEGRGSRFEVADEESFTVDLVDANGQVVTSQAVTTNGFGSASGTFTVPVGRLLGAWAVRSSRGGTTTVRIEEYKRPTFEVSLAEPAAALRLNQPAKLTGEARYYFGLPVTAATVRWRATREPVYPYWWGWWFGGSARTQSQIVAAGTATVDDKGAFEVAFTPEADEREKGGEGVSYRFVVTADVTDEGGETRSADRSLRLGFVAVEASIEPEAAFFLRGEPAKVTLRRTDLDGTPRAGDATWRLLRLRQPEATRLPADQPPAWDPRQRDRYQTPGDALRARWDTDVTPEGVLHGWPDGEEVGRGAARHGEKGLAQITLPGVPAGAYRLRYATRDAFGATYETERDLIVVEPRATPLAVPAILRVERASVPLGGTARVLVHSGLPGQSLRLQIFRRERPVETRTIESSQGAQVVEIPIGEDEHGGFSVALSAVRDHQLMRQQEQVIVPWDEKRLKIEFATFRDKVRPRTRETWRVTVKGSDQADVAAGAAELLAYMYDKSLDLFAPHVPPDPLGVYPGPPGTPELRSSLRGNGESWLEGTIAELPGEPSLVPAQLRFLDGYGIGGPGRRMLRGMVGGVEGGAMAEATVQAMEVPAPAAPPPPGKPMLDQRQVVTKRADTEHDEVTTAAPTELRSEFAETAFWYPHLVTGPDGSASFEFNVPDSVTEWNLWVHALTRDLRGGSTKQQVRTVKELMVRPYLPRFLREGDEAVLQVAVNDAGEKPFTGTLRFEILDPATGESLAPAFGLPQARTTSPFTVQPGAGTTLSFPVKAPAHVGTVSFRITAQAGDWSDGEQRPLPVLPGRMHLAQSRFVTLHDKDRRVMRFDDMAASDDPTMLQDQLVVTVDGQLFNTVLAALPYLVQYPYECTEQTLNRFLSTAIVSKVFADHPALAKLGAELAARRDTPLEPWALDDPNRRMTLEETPWLVTARGGDAGDLPLIKVLDPVVAKAQRDSAIAKLEKDQTAIGAFPWWAGGPPSPYMTLYVLAGLSRAREAGIDVPQDMVVRAWGYMHQHFLDEMVREMRKDDCCWEEVTLLGYVLSNYEDRGKPGANEGGGDWTGGVFSDKERREMLAFSFRHWKQHSPLLKSMLALTLHRAGRPGDAKLVFDSVMDSARTTQDEGTSWAPEDRAWLWYNDTIETHAYALRTLSELAPKDARRHGLVQWLLLNKKLNHWSSTRGTAEVIYALVGYLESEGALGIEESARVSVGPRQRTFRFLPDRVGPVVEDTGATPPAPPRTAPGPEAPARSNQLVIPGPEVDPRSMSEVVVEKETKGFLFASATWQFSTEKLPAEARGDLFSVTRAYFLRVQEGGKWRLVPLAEGTQLHPGDQLEVQLSIRSRAAAEYVHLRDPRPAGCEPENLYSGWKWEILSVYEEIRDSGANYFFEWLPAGEYTFRHRLRVNMAGTFRVAPAELQSMYAPEFVAYSAGAVVKVSPAKPARD